MTCKYCSAYIARARKEVSHFAESCRVLRLNPDSSRDAEAIVRSLMEIGEHGTIRLARRYEFVTNEDEFRMVAQTGLEFYWMVLDMWDDFAAGRPSPVKG